MRSRKLSLSGRRPRGRPPGRDTRTSAVYHRSMLSTDRLTFFTGVGAIVVTIAECSTNARFNDVNARIGEIIET